MEGEEREDCCEQEGGEVKINFFHKTWVRTTLPDDSKIKLKSEEGWADLIGGYSGRTEGSFLSAIKIKYL